MEQDLGMIFDKLAINLLAKDLLHPNHTIIYHSRDSGGTMAQW